VRRDLPLDVVMFWYSYPTGMRQTVCGHTAFGPEWVSAALEAIDEQGIGKVAMKPLTWFARALIDRAGELPPYRRQWVAAACRNRTGEDLGDDPEAYREPLLDPQTPVL